MNSAVSKGALIIEMIGCGWSGQSDKELKYSLLRLHFLQSFRIFWIRNIKNIFFKRNKISNPFRLVSWCNHGTKRICPLTTQRWHCPIKHLLIIQKEGPNELRIYREGDYLLLIQLCGTETPNDKRWVKFMSGRIISSCIGAVH